MRALALFSRRKVGVKLGELDSRIQTFQPHSVFKIRIKLLIPVARSAIDQNFRPILGEDQVLLEAWNLRINKKLLDADIPLPRKDRAEFSLHIRERWLP
ncbi:hypothetical protein [Thermosulfurimonas dismutans]|uniref:Uncharacterized protein n=1 Tax=Thermosulfurimonas dismutans TaxID=999894 RepID=A0A179D5B3_9BACT|nr:hypothetical protein [Thermosulfurimonas dismutans]OAQ21247.1 hypothetical protein TDIS_0467 [Thermosulfurimonas dismutans]